MLRMKGHSVLGLSVESVWFSPPGSMIQSDCDVTKYIRVKQPLPDLKHSFADSYYILITDLSKSGEEILEEFSRTTKQQIRKCMREEEIKIDFFTQEEIMKNPEILEDFKKTYMSYCDNSNNPSLKKNYSEKNIDQLIEYKSIMVSRAEFLNGRVYHLYARDKENSYLVYIASDRLNTEVTSILAGMANKLLIYKDMLWMKEHGGLKYELGNITDFENPNSIDKFKMLFNGERLKVNSYLVGNTVKGKIAVGILVLLRNMGLYK